MTPQDNQEHVDPQISPIDVDGALGLASIIEDIGKQSHFHFLLVKVDIAPVSVHSPSLGPS